MPALVRANAAQAPLLLQFLDAPLHRPFGYPDNGRQFGTRTHDHRGTVNTGLKRPSRPPTATTLPPVSPHDAQTMFIGLSTLHRKTIAGQKANPKGPWAYTYAGLSTKTPATISRSASGMVAGAGRPAHTYARAFSLVFPLVAADVTTLRSSRPSLHSRVLGGGLTTSTSPRWWQPTSRRRLGGKYVESFAGDVERHLGLEGLFQIRITCYIIFHTDYPTGSPPPECRPSVSQVGWCSIPAPTGSPPPKGSARERRR